MNVVAPHTTTIDILYTARFDKSSGGIEDGRGRRYC